MQIAIGIGACFLSPPQASGTPSGQMTGAFAASASFTATLIDNSQFLVDGSGNTLTDDSGNPLTNG